MLNLARSPGLRAACGFATDFSVSHVRAHMPLGGTVDGLDISHQKRGIRC